MKTTKFILFFALLCILLFASLSFAAEDDLPVPIRGSQKNKIEEINFELSLIGKD